MNSTYQKAANSLALIFMLVMNTLAISLPLGGKTTGELSDIYPNLFVPAGFTFSIWSIIYLLLIGMIVYQWIASAEKSEISKVGPWFIVNGLANGAWIVAWHYELVPVSLIIMFVLLGSLIMIYRNLSVNYFGSNGVKWLVNVPISVYLGWISVATIANFTTVFVHYGWSGFGISEDVWSVIILIIAVVLGCLMMYRHKDIFYAAVIAWASYGILSKRLADTVSMDAKIEHMSQVAIYIMVIGILLSVTLGILGNRKTGVLR
ncbi:MAG: hypothetical protein ACJA1A_002585 [Saprospiraceae bacterium]|jgi:hypothetical protein